jgi:geranylgeranyl diphosphate synthase type II
MDSQDYSSFLERLGDYRHQTMEILQRSIPDKEPRRYLYTPIREFLERSGKGLRSALCLATCGAFGGRIEDALVSAAAIEMLHNAFLVHDDIEDGSEFRRGHPTMHAQYGVPIAVNVGDAMQALGWGIFRKNSSTLSPNLVRQLEEEFHTMSRVTHEGQAIELGWNRDNRCDISDEDYLRMTLKKTCWYSFINPCRVGALIARPEDSNLERFNSFGNYLGSAFQIQDDILNLTGSRQKYGKEIAGDLYEGKRTLMLSHLFGQGSPEETQNLKDFLSKPRNGKYADEIDRVMESLKTHGSIEYARCSARELRDAAEQAFFNAYQDAPESEDKTFIQQSLSYMIDRTS